MSSDSGLQPPGEKLRRAIGWLSECLQDDPTRKRRDLLREAEIRFDLSPAECEFLDKNFASSKKTA
ncbi:hypothetical protein [Desulfurivibrio sp. C05AmB]|jgi:hypothetical protein|uniref:hypothetical protein n=1 Tax=Desulfurivibrio sp. C05AmB TaxID=3374371 RepID=UPI00376EDD20